MIIRVDDVSMNTDFSDLNKAAEYFRSELDAEVWYCINLFCRTAPGAVYPELPLKGRGLDFFCNVDRFTGAFAIPSFVNLVSHGLLHAEHGAMSYEAQYLSIVTSCRFLKTDTFVPPFMSFNANTLNLCAKERIKLIDGVNWLNLETEPFDRTHNQWYFHHWRTSFKQLKESIDVSKVNV